MKKRIILFALLIVLSAHVVIADSIEVRDEAINIIVIKELSNPATFRLNITNNYPFYDTFTIDTLLDIEIRPKDLGTISPRKSKTFEVEVIPSARTRERNEGKFAFEYFVKGVNAKLEKDIFIIELLPLAEVLDVILPEYVKGEDKTVDIGFKFNKDLRLDIDISIESDLLKSKEDSVTLTSTEKKLRYELISEKNAGVYETVFTFKLGNNTAILTKNIILGSTVVIVDSEEKEGMFLARKITITKTNNGNSVTKVTLSYTGSILGSLFTTFSEAPLTKKEGGKYIYEWNKELNPGKSYSVTINSNYYLPFIILLLLLAAGAIFKVVTTSPVQVNKRAIRVRTKSGVFASKIIISIKNTGKPITNVKVIDRLPVFTEVLKERFGAVTPSEIKKRTIIWDFSRLEHGEEIMFSYVVYSKISVFGKLEVPPAVVTYRDQKDEFKESMSNRIYILSEEEKRPEEL